MNENQLPQQREELEISVVDLVSDLPGVARLVPSFRQVLTATAQRLFGGESRTATGVDIVTEGSEIRVYVDLYTDGSRPAGDVVDDVHAGVTALFRERTGAAADIKVRVIGVALDR